MGVIECLIHQHSIPHSIASDQGIDFTVREVDKCDSGPMFMETTYLTIFLTTPEQLVRIVKWSFEDLVTVPIILLRPGHTTESEYNAWCRFSHSQDSWVQEAKDRNGNVSIYYHT